MKLKIIIPIAIIIILALPYFLCDSERKVLDKETRASHPGSYVELSDGVVHYELAGPSTGEVVVLIHGGTFPSFCWDKNFNALSEAGFRVLRYDVYGRGFSDRPDLVYNEDPWDRQLEELIKKLELKRPVNLVGLSMGGVIAAIFTDRHPEMVKGLCFIGPAGLPINIPAAGKLAKWPLLGEYIMAVIGEHTMVSRFDKIFYHSENAREFIGRFKEQMQYKGFKRSVLSMLRNYPMNDQRETFKRLAKQKRPILLIWGEEDHSNPYANNEELRKLIPNIEFYSIPEGAHSVYIEQADVVNMKLIQFFNEN